jgi:hypothetical protein
MRSVDDWLPVVGRLQDGERLAARAVRVLTVYYLVFASAGLPGFCSKTVPYSCI